MGVEKGPPGGATGVFHWVDEELIRTTAGRTAAIAALILFSSWTRTRGGVSACTEDAAMTMPSDDKAMTHNSLLVEL